MQPSVEALEHDRPAFPKIVGSCVTMNFMQRWMELSQQLGVCLRVYVKVFWESKSRPIMMC